MEPLIICFLIFLSVWLLFYRLFMQKIVDEVHLPLEITGKDKHTPLEKILNVPAQLTAPLVAKDYSFFKNLKPKLMSAGEPLNASQLLALKFLLTIFLPIIVFIGFKSTQPGLLIFSMFLGYFLPDYWLAQRRKKRRSAVLKDLPHVIDLLNICVGAGLDFMVAVNRVIHEFRPCVIVDELKIMAREIQMGSSRRDALKNIAKRINSPEVISFVRTLLQADRMGTPIGEALKMQSEEIRIRRFQRGEEMALKAPIKLLLPLILFILPVVMIIVAGPVLIQFTRGGLMKF
jgi:tight adherence protein C